MTPFRFEGRTAIVTGAAGGIGRAIAGALAARGCNLVLADINREALEDTLAGTNRVSVSRHALDVGRAEAIAAFHGEVAAGHASIDLLFNNAGVALGGTFEQLTAEEFEWLIDINFWGVVRMTRAFLPLLHASPDARLVNLSSLFGLIAPPGQTAYCASKFAIRGFSESLRKELAGSKVGVTVAHPGGVATRIATSARIAAAMPAEERGDQARFEKLLRLPPERAGETIVEAVARRRDRILVGGDARLMSLIERLAPVSYWKLLAGAAEHAVRAPKA